MQLPSAVSLMQMPRTVLGLSEVKKKGIPVIVVADCVVSGGISASYAACGDFLFFEGKKTKWMFSGPRVSANVSNNETPEDFLEGGWAMSHGHGDYMIEKRKDTKDFLIKFLNVILKKDQSSIIDDKNKDNINETTKINKETREAS